MIYIYLITNKINNKVYVGQTIHIEKRFSQHIYYAKTKQEKCIKLERAINKHGSDNFIFEIIASTNDQRIINKLEKFYIKIYDSINNGYNIKEGGGNGPLPQSIKDKIGAAQMGAKNHMFGKQLTDEHKEKLSIAFSGEKHPLYKTHLTQETKDKISKSAQGRISPTKGIKLTDEWKNKISITRKQTKIATGENNPAAKLNIEQVQIIKQLLIDNELTQKEIAKQFNVSKSTIAKIKTGTHWK